MGAMAQGRDRQEYIPDAAQVWKKFRNKRDGKKRGIGSGQATGRRFTISTAVFGRSCVSTPKCLDTRKQRSGTFTSVDVDRGTTQRTHHLKCLVVGMVIVSVRKSAEDRHKNDKKHGSLWKKKK